MQNLSKIIGKASKTIRITFYVWKDWYSSKKSTLNEIRIGYTNLFLYKIGMFAPEYVEPYLYKRKFCEECPIQSKIMGIAYCDPNKEVDGEYGCGCVRDAKIWSDSECPLGKF